MGAPTAGVLLWPLVMVLASGCLPERVPKPPAAAQPRFVGRYILAFMQPSPTYPFTHISLVRRETAAGKRKLRLVAANRQSDRERLVVGRMPARLRQLLQANPWPSRRQLQAYVRRSELGRLLERLDVRWPQLARGFSFSSEALRYEITGRGVRAQGPAAAVTLAPLPAAPAAAARVLWLRDPGRARTGLEIRYAGQPTTRFVRLLEHHETSAKLISERAMQAHQQQAYARARTLWLRAHRLTPEAADTLYNLACSEARLGDTQAALRHLRLAIQLGGDRMRGYARTDADLRPLHRQHAFWALLGKSSSNTGQAQQ